MRLYQISLPGTQRKWETTSCMEAMRFVLSFKSLQGFNLYSEKYEGKEIPTIQCNY